MSFYPEDLSIPPGLRTDQFLLEPLAPKHVALDYATLMASKEMLRMWGGHEWPQDNFSLEDNLADMQMHHHEHQRREAFTYTILDPSASRCLGCVYIRDLAELKASAPGHPALKNLPEYSAHMRFWVTASPPKEDVDRRLLADLQRWFAEDWLFNRVLVHTRTAFEQQVKLFNSAGLVPAFSLEYPGRGGEHLFFELIPG